LRSKLQAFVIKTELTESPTERSALAGDATLDQVVKADWQRPLPSCKVKIEIEEDNSTGGSRASGSIGPKSPRRPHREAPKPSRKASVASLTPRRARRGGQRGGKRRGIVIGNGKGKAAPAATIPKWQSPRKRLTEEHVYKGKYNNKGKGKSKDKSKFLTSRRCSTTLPRPKAMPMQVPARPSCKRSLLTLHLHL
jgi:hypothetical protein